MRSTTFKLFKLQIDEVYNIFKVGSIKKLLFSAGKYGLALLGLFVAVYLVSARIFYLGFKLDEYLIAIVLLLTQLIALVFAVGNIVSNLFLSSTNELLLTLPASANEIFLSKIMVIYVREVIVNSIYTLPLLFGLGFFKGFGAYYLIMLFPLMLILPLLPLSIAAALALPAMKIMSILKKQPLISVLLMAAAIATLLVFYVNALTVISKFDVGSKQYETVTSVNKSLQSFGSSTLIFYLLAKGIMFPLQFYYIFAYAALGLFFFALAAFLIRPFFFRAAIESREDSQSKMFGKKFKRQSALWSLVKKEFLTGFRSPGYVFQYFIFALIMPLIVFLYDELLLSMDIVTQVGRMMIAGSHVLIVAMLSMLSNIVSASAISREGGNFYIIKTSPVSYYVQTGAKLIYNALFSITAILLTCITTFATATSLENGVIIGSTIAAVFVSLGHMSLSYDMDLKNPTLNWYNSGDVTSVSVNTTKSVLYAIALSVTMAAVIFATSSAVFGWIMLIALSFVFFIWRLYILILRVSYQYDRQEM